MAPHLLICVSFHGYGHIGQTAPVLASLRERLPGLRVTVRSSAPGFKLSERLGTAIERQRAEVDVGMVQRTALEVDIDATASAYRAFHEDWSTRVAVEADTLRRLRPDLVLANVPYLSLAAANQAEIPGVALCSICWSDIYRHFYQEGVAETQVILEQMLQSYNSAECFLQPAPSMPMQDIRNGRPIGPVAQLGKARRAELLKVTRTSAGDRLIMISLGGMEARLPIEKWAGLSGFHFVVPKAWKCSHPRVTAFEELGMPFADALASCDALIAKPGYGSFVEGACLGMPILYVERPNWPEVPFLVEWLKREGRCSALDVDDIAHGDLRSKLESLWSLPAVPVKPYGIDQAADHLTALLDGRALA